MSQPNNTCNHCFGEISKSRMVSWNFRQMCDTCEAMTLAERIETFPHLRELAETLGNYGLGINGPFTRDWLKPRR